jgi:plastocyanin
MKPSSLASILLLSGIAVGQAEAQTGTVEGRVSLERGRPGGAVVFLVSAAESSHDPSADPVVIDQVDLRFIPRVVAVAPGATVAFPNSDPIMHNVFSPRGPGNGFNLGTYPPNETRYHRFTDVGMHVILCHVHPEMVAYVAVVPTRHHALVSDDGEFAIRGVPAGRHVLQAWHGRRATGTSEVAVPAGGTARVEFLLGSGR